MTRFRRVAALDDYCSPHLADSSAAILSRRLLSFLRCSTARFFSEYGFTPGRWRSGVDSILSSDHPLSILALMRLYGIRSNSAHSDAHRVSPLNVIIRLLEVFRACSFFVLHFKFPMIYPFVLSLRSRDVPGGGSPTWA